MSRIIAKSNNSNPYSHFVKTDDGNIYYVDSCDTPDCSFETMVFRAEELGTPGCQFEVLDWGELYLEHYSDFDEMVERHSYICTHLEELLGKEED